MKTKLLILIILFVTVSCSTSKHVVVIAFSKQLHAVLYNDNSESIQTASKTYTQKDDIAIVSNSVNEQKEEIKQKEEIYNNKNEAYYSEEIPAKIEKTYTTTEVIKHEDNEILITANIIEFDFDSYELKREYDDGIEEIYDYLNDNKNINLIIEGHTDNIGDSNYNIYLSENRAKAIFDELINKGIERKRLRYIGYGSYHSSEYNAADRKCQFVIINNDTEEQKYKKENENDFIKLKP